MFTCYDMAGKKITTSVFSDCNPNLDMSMTASEFAAIANGVSATPSLADFFAIPPAADLHTIFWQALSLVLIAYLVSWAFGVVINFASDKK